MKDVPVTIKARDPDCQTIWIENRIRVIDKRKRRFAAYLP